MCREVTMCALVPLLCTSRRHPRGASDVLLEGVMARGWPVRSRPASALHVLL
ncbi:conserved hypothetical protein [Ricinus communis]|uniref:Uncharacterized protein n=1 Tax=Ricinus communis TaxID=3988 RepID=B9SDQ4_RICCO|nr:conserved hypothetical protein [Ricinus communis]